MVRTAVGSGDQCQDRRLLLTDVAPRAVTAAPVSATANAAIRKRGEVLSTEVTTSATATAVICRAAVADVVPRSTVTTTNGALSRNRNNSPQPVDSRIVAWNCAP